MDNTDPKDNVAREEDAGRDAALFPVPLRPERPALSFRGAGGVRTFTTHSVFWVAERHEPDGRVRVYFLAPTRGETRFRLWEADVLTPGTARVLRADSRPTGGFDGRVDLAAPRARGGCGGHAFSPTAEEQRQYIHGVLRREGRLPDLGHDDLCELTKQTEWVDWATRACCHALAPLDGPGREGVLAWDSSLPFARACLEAAHSALPDPLRRALDACGASFGSVYSALFRAMWDLDSLRPGAEPTPIGIDWMDKAAAASFRRVRGELDSGLAFDQWRKVQQSRWRRRREDEPDLITMQDRLDSGAASLEEGTAPEKGCYPAQVLVTSPPTMSMDGYIPRTSLDARGTDESDDSSTTRAEETGSAASYEGDRALEAVEAAECIRDFLPVLREVVAERAARPGRGLLTPTAVARRWLMPLVRRQVTAAFVARFENVSERSRADLRKAVRVEREHVLSDPRVAAFARRAGF